MDDLTSRPTCEIIEFVPRGKIAEPRKAAPIVIAIALDGVAATLRALVHVEAAASLALRTLGNADVHGDAEALRGVRQVFAALSGLLNAVNPTNASNVASLVLAPIIIEIAIDDVAMTRRVISRLEAICNHAQAMLDEATKHGDAAVSRAVRRLFDASAGLSDDGD